jgi:hypothetical protein
VTRAFWLMFGVGKDFSFPTPFKLASEIFRLFSNLQKRGKGIELKYEKT